MSANGRAEEISQSERGVIIPIPRDNRAQLDPTTNSLSPLERGEASRVAELYAALPSGIGADYYREMVSVTRCGRDRSLLAVRGCRASISEYRPRPHQRGAQENWPLPQPNPPVLKFLPRIDHKTTRGAVRGQRLVIMKVVMTIHLNGPGDAGTY
jgi:hypothetical protein